MWTGRFSQATADLVLRYGESVSYDWKLYRHDVAGSIAHARAQMKAGLLTQEEFETLSAEEREKKCLQTEAKFLAAGADKVYRTLEELEKSLQTG